MGSARRRELLRVDVPEGYAPSSEDLRVHGVVDRYVHEMALTEVAAKLGVDLDESRLADAVDAYEEWLALDGLLVDKMREAVRAAASEGGSDGPRG